jgi:hypothetical protein
LPISRPRAICLRDIREDTLCIDIDKTEQLVGPPNGSQDALRRSHICSISAQNVGTDKDSERRQRDAIEASRRC